MLTYVVSVQIADFGMARDVADDNYYIIKGGKIPIKWTPPEVSQFYSMWELSSDGSRVCSTSQNMYFASSVFNLLSDLHQ